MKKSDFLYSWGKILRGRIPLLSIEITRECPLHCPGCYAYGDSHLGGETTLRDVSDFRGDELVSGIIGLVERHDPLQVSLVGGEPLMRHRELSSVLPVLSARGVFTMVVTSAVIPIPSEWMALPRVTVAVSVDGLSKDHDERRKPATYERILRNIEGCNVYIHWTVVRKHLEEPGYLEEYARFWSARPEVRHIWVSVYTPQKGEESAEILTPDQRRSLTEQLPALARKYPKLLVPDGMARAFVEPPANPAECIFSRMSVNYTADLRSRVEPCIFGGEPDCAQCGCSISAALHWVGNSSVAGPLRVKHLVRASMGVGGFVNRFAPARRQGIRWGDGTETASPSELVQLR